MKDSSDQWFARVSDKGDSLAWQPLSEHLENVAIKAGSFANDFNARNWGHLAGLWHDAGKYQQLFQDKLKGKNINVEHSGVGAALAFNKFGAAGIPLAFVIAGHHTGLANHVQSLPDTPLPLKERIVANKEIFNALSKTIPETILNMQFPQVIERFQGPTSPEKARSVEFWIRFLFSCLVDADRLDAELFDEPAKLRHSSNYATLDELDARLDQYLTYKMQSIPKHLSTSAVNNVRRIALKKCQDAACNSLGIYSITLPTGGGKTLSAMSFALKHARFNNLKRVIVVIPYTSIIEQNAAEYRLALGKENVIEHHSNYDPYDGESEATITRYQMAIDNWDAPVIVTTTVQFFESLFTANPSKCRKLHNIANSVIILDEVQTIPPGYLASILEALNELSANYGCSIVLSTATPPALAKRSGFNQGLINVQSIIPDPQQLTDQLKRVDYCWPQPSAEAEEWPVLATSIAACGRVLTIVDRRKDARELSKEVKRICDDGTVFHISALMCPAHRLDVLHQIKEHMLQNKDCRVISTQVVEAGVDLDFPVVYRALAGLTSIIQAAGRCNREGLIEKGRVIIFKPVQEPPVGVLRTAKQITESILKLNGTIDPYDLGTIEGFFKQLYFTQDLDVHNIQAEREQFNYQTVDRNFRLIDDGFTRNVVVPYKDSIDIISEIRNGKITKRNLRQLQLYTVNIYPDAFNSLTHSHVIEEIAENIYAVTDSRYYDSFFGLIIGDENLPLTPLVV